MNVVPVNLATEDELSEVVLLRILARLKRYAVGTPYRRGGYGYLKKTIHGWNRAARCVPFIVLTDLDNCECPSRLIEDWLDSPRHPNLLFRVAVREVEAWLLADRVNFSRFLVIAQESVPMNKGSRVRRQFVIASCPSGTVQRNKDPTTTRALARLYATIGILKRQGPHLSALQERSTD
jgi:hypothetical protein